MNINKIIPMLLVTMLIKHNKSTKTQQEHLTDYIEGRLVKKNFGVLTSNQKQCVILREYLKAIPSDNIYNKRNELWNVFSQKEYYLKSFQSFLFLILKQVSRHQESSWIDTEKFNQLLAKLTNMSLSLPDDLKNQIDDANNKLVTESQKVDFLINALNNYQSYFVRNFFVHIDNHDEKIEKLKGLAKVEFEGKVKEIQDLYITLKEKVLKLQKKKEETTNDIKKLDVANKESIIEKYKKAKNFIKIMKSEIPAFDDNEADPKYFEFLKSTILQEFNQKISDKLNKNLVNAKLSFEEKLKIQKKIDAEKIIVLYNEMVKGFQYQYSLTVESRHQVHLKGDPYVPEHLDYEKYKDFIRETKGYNKYVNKMKTLETRYKNNVETIHENVKKLIDSYLKDIKITKVVKFVKNYKEKILGEMKAFLTEIKKLEGKINEEVIELSRINMKKKLLESKLDSEVVIPNSVYIDLETDIQAARDAIVYNENLSNSEINHKIKEINEKKIICCTKDNKLIPEKKGEYNQLDEEDNKYRLIYKIYIMERGLKVLDLKNDIIEILNLLIGTIMGKLQNMEGDKKCLSVPETSFYIFRMIKTNMIFFEKPFWKNFLNIFLLKNKKSLFYTIT